MNEYLQEKIMDKESVAILCSGGMDSLSLVLSSMELGIKPVLYTFYLKSYESPDLYSSRNIASLFQLPLVEVAIDDRDVTKLQKDVVYMMKTFKVKKKTAIQCIYPFLYVAPLIKEKVVLSGLCADDLYGTPRSMAKHRNDPATFSALREARILNPSASSYKEIKELLERHDKQFMAPYKECEKLVNYFRTHMYKDMHSPKQKWLTYRDYQAEIETYDLFRLNSNLQCGSRIREWHEELMKTEWNKGFKTIVALYNDVYRTHLH